MWIDNLIEPSLSSVIYFYPYESKIIYIYIWGSHFVGLWFGNAYNYLAQFGRILSSSTAVVLAPAVSNSGHYHLFACKKWKDRLYTPEMICILCLWYVSENKSFYSYRHNFYSFRASNYFLNHGIYCAAENWEMKANWYSHGIFICEIRSIRLNMSLLLVF